MNVEKREVRDVTYSLNLTHREMQILSTVASNTSGRGDARFLYDLAELSETDDDIGVWLDNGDLGIEIHFDNTENCGMRVEANS